MSLSLQERDLKESKKEAFFAIANSIPREMQDCFETLSVCVNYEDTHTEMGIFGFDFDGKLISCSIKINPDISPIEGETWKWD